MKSFAAALILLSWAVTSRGGEKATPPPAVIILGENEAIDNAAKIWQRHAKKEAANLTRMVQERDNRFSSVNPLSNPKRFREAHETLLRGTAGQFRFPYWVSGDPKPSVPNYLKVLRLKVDQRLSETEAVVEIQLPGLNASLYHPQKYTYFNGEIEAHLSGANLANIVDDTSFSGEVIVKITGTKRVGLKTMYAIEICQDEEIKSLEGGHIFRGSKVFQLQDGSKFVGDPVGYSRGTLSIFTRDGLKMLRFSELDRPSQAALREWLKNQR